MTPEELQALQKDDPRYWGDYVLVDGVPVKRDHVGYDLVASKKNPSLLMAADGTVYERMKDGCLRKLISKKAARRLWKAASENSSGKAAQAAASGTSGAQAANEPTPSA